MVICTKAGMQTGVGPNGGGTSQDLKTGYLLGATPLYQQLGLIIGADVPEVIAAGQSVPFETSSELKIDGAVVIAKGVKTTGRIAEVERKRKRLFGGGAKVLLTMSEIRGANGVIKIRATSQSDGDDNARPLDIPAARRKKLAASKGDAWIAYVDGKQTVKVPK